MMQPRKPKGAPNGAGGQYTTHPTDPTGLPHLDQYTGNGPQVDDRALERTALYHPDSLIRGRAWHERITRGAVSPVFCQVGLYGVVTFSGRCRRLFWTVSSVWGSFGFVGLVIS
ncbi:hypothetical protein PG2012B_0974 [Bifidobacterium pseudolongum subsp. globosum]|nr:hypothetical protein PG2012B_0974 [Bifidobacterium pseudolongum subsp. globosum]